MRQVFDVVVGGGAVMGSSIACQLAMHPGFFGRILVVEPDPSYARAASALSASSIRQQFSQPVNIAISLHGIAFLRAIGEHLAVDGDIPAISLHEGGYLYLGGETAVPLFCENNKIQRAMGADIALLDNEALAKRFAWLRCDGLTIGSFGLGGEGWFDGYGLMQAFRRKARALGVEYRQDRVTAFALGGCRITAVRLESGAEIACGAFINAAGAAGAAKLAASAGFPVPVRAKKRSVFQFSCKTQLPGFPLLIDTSGVWCRPEGEGYIAGHSPDDLDEADHGTDFEPDWPQFEEVVWPALATRVPAFEQIRPGRAWAGHYDMNLIDHNAIVGRLGELGNGYIAAGFSGHGIQQAPAIGRGLAELIVEGRYSSIDLSELGFERLAAGRKLVERNVI